MNLTNLPKDLFYSTTKIDNREWLLTDGCGGYANFTLNEIPLSRYNNLYIFPENPPTNRTAILHSILHFPNEKAKKVVVGPFVIYEYKSFKKVILLYNRMLIVVYEAKTDIADFVITPLFSLRNHHHLRTKKVRIDWEFSDNKLRNKKSGLTFYIYNNKGQIFQSNPHYEIEYIYEREIERGLDHNENLVKFFEIKAPLKKGEKFILTLSPDPLLKELDIDNIIKEKLAFARRIIENSRLSTNASAYPLILNSNDFIVKRRDTNSPTVIAGYPWFTDWGRDTMISFEGLFLINERFTEARELLLSFSRHIRKGLIPNHFSDESGEPIYNTIDASLWYFVAGYNYYRYTGDKTFAEEILPAFREIIKWHIEGTDFNIKMDPEDFLLSGGSQGVQLTWMDAKVGDWVVTPRHGKAIEINALWYNALKIFNIFSQNQESQYVDIEKGIERNIHKFYNDKEVFDVLYDSVIRPNMLIPIILPFRPFPEEVEKRIIKIVGSKLLTPYGIRTLDPAHPEYKGRYEGDIISRDGAYHQGTAWPFLTGFYIEAIVNVYGKKKLKNKALKILSPLMKHIYDSGCIGSISEIFDGDPPQRPRGCFAQAWSVATILKALYLLD